MLTIAHSCACEILPSPTDPRSYGSTSRPASTAVTDGETSLSTSVIPRPAWRRSHAPWPSLSDFKQAHHGYIESWKRLTRTPATTTREQATTLRDDNGYCCDGPSVNQPG